MLASELRVGNLVYFKEDILEFDFENGWNFYFIKPIQLTEEWLLKFGFEIRKKEYSSYYHIGINPITKDWLFDVLWINGYEFPFYRNGHFMIKYVHQLQNLYFALTREELKLNLD